MDIGTRIFGATGHFTDAQECARAVAVFLYGYVAVRLVGRRIFGRWAALDIIVSIVIGSNLSRALTGQAPIGGTMLATTVVLGLHWLLAQLAARRAELSHLIEGRSCQLVRDGQALRGPMLRWSISEADLYEALRQRGLRAVEEAEFATLEPSGSIAVFPKPDGKARAQPQKDPPSSSSSS